MNILYEIKKIRYNLICALLVLLVGAAVLLRVVFVDNINQNSSITNPVEPETQGPTDPSDQDKADPGDDDDETQYEKDKNLPSSRYPAKLLNYCIGKVNQANSYQLNLTYATNIKGTIAGVSAVGNHKTTGICIKSGEERYEELKFEALDDISLKFSPQHNIQAMYTDNGGQLNHYWETAKGEFDWSKANYSTWTPTRNAANQYWYYDFLYGGVPNSYGYSDKIEFNNSCASISLKTQTNQRTGKGEYILTVKMVDMEKYPMAFLRAHVSFSKQLYIKTYEQTVVFTIDKETGWIKSFVKKDTINGNPKSFSSVNLTFSTTFTANYSNYNQPIQVNHPDIPNV